LKRAILDSGSASMPMQHHGVHKARPTSAGFKTAFQQIAAEENLEMPLRR